jgi:hypothetical protein
VIAREMTWANRLHDDLGPAVAMSIDSSAGMKWRGAKRRSKYGLTVCDRGYDTQLPVKRA